MSLACDRLLPVVAAIFEAPMGHDQARRLAELMQERIAQRAPAVLNATLLWDAEPAPGVGRFIAVWESRDAWDRYLSSVTVPGATALMREVGAEPTLTVVPALYCG